MKYYVGPLEGITNRVFRQTHRKFFGAEVGKYYAPFLSPTADFRFSPRVLDELAPELGEAAPLVPQLLVNSAAQFIPAARELAALGFREVNLNLGCPSRTVTAKGKGAGLLADPAALDRLLGEVFDALAGVIGVSVKTRMGLAAAAEFTALLPVFNRYPIAELTVHARVRDDFYKKPASPAALAAFADALAAPLCYNGDVTSPAAAAEILPLFPGLGAVMLGRGVIADPALPGRLSGRPAPDKAVYRAFHDELLEGCWALGWDRRAVLCHMKELWDYFAARFPDSRRAAKLIRKAESYEAYLDGVNAMFSLPLHEN